MITLSLPRKFKPQFLQIQSELLCYNRGSKRSKLTSNDSTDSSSFQTNHLKKRMMHRALIASAARCVTTMRINKQPEQKQKHTQTQTPFSSMVVCASHICNFMISRKNNNDNKVRSQQVVRAARNRCDQDDEESEKGTVKKNGCDE